MLPLSLLARVSPLLLALVAGCSRPVPYESPTVESFPAPSATPLPSAPPTPNPTEATPAQKPILAAARVAESTEVKVDSALPVYEVSEGVTGELLAIGSSTLGNVMTRWVSEFIRAYPSVKFQTESSGSAGAASALIDGTAPIASMSRPMSAEEVGRFEQKYGYKPTEVRVAIDAVTIIVQKENPLEGLSLRQVDAIFSSTLKAGGPDVRTWGELGLTGDWVLRPLSLYGRSNASGTRAYVKENLLRQGEFKPTVTEAPTWSSTVQRNGTDLAGIGYASIGFISDEVRIVPLTANDGGKFIEPTYAACLGGEYPLTRFLVIYLNRKPGEPLGKAVEEFVKFVLSKNGQELVVKAGFFPLPAMIAGAERKKVVH